MAERTVKVPNITCGHCVMTIQREVGELDGVQAVQADQATREVTVTWDEGSTSWNDVEAFMIEINYPPAG
jgi:copper chaperone CopZ